MRAEPETIEAWAWELIHTLDLEGKLQPADPPAEFAQAPVARRATTPGRPACLRVIARAERTPRPGALVHTEQRARLLHVFFHHELQAAELFAWAICAFPETPESFRRGLLTICLDEVRHARLYRDQIERLGASIGDFPVRDWIWQRLSESETPTQFVSLMGLGFEGGNLDHASIWAKRFRAVGDEQGARVQEIIEREEISHVAFAVRWFREWTGSLDFESWCSILPAPLTPTVMRGKTLNREARQAAGQDQRFLDALDAWDGTMVPED